MTKISATIVADSKAPSGDRLTTMLVTFPRFILAELNTHRMLSKNSASSRAIPFAKMVESIQNDPFIPIAWQKDHKGMQGNDYFTFDLTIKQLEKQWLLARDAAVHHAKMLAMGDGYEGLTKQLCNRLLEPFMWHTVLISGTEWQNFFDLRCPKYVTPVGGKDEDGKDWEYKSRKGVMEGHSNKANLEMMDKFTELDWLKLNKGQADIHMMALAEAMYDVYNESTPKLLQAGEWHIPFGDNIITENFPKTHPVSIDETSLAIKIAVARCARVSYTVVGEEGKKPNYGNDLKLHDILAASGHWSPFEHCAKLMTDKEYVGWIKGEDVSKLSINIFDADSKGWCRNYKGFIQYREVLKNEKLS